MIKYIDDIALEGIAGGAVGGRKFKRKKLHKKLARGGGCSALEDDDMDDDFDVDGDDVSTPVRAPTAGQVIKLA